MGVPYEDRIGALHLIHCEPDRPVARAAIVEGVEKDDLIAIGQLEIRGA